jgi:RNA-directed DNA polymerase
MALRFGRFARQNEAQYGREPQTFDFLGFTHYGGQTSAGSFKLRRRTSLKKFRAKLREVKEWLRRRRHEVKAGAILHQAKRRVQGHLNYFAITDNRRSCHSFRSQVERLLFKWLNRRSQRDSYTWEQFVSALAWVRWPRIRIRPHLDPFCRVGLNPC